MRVSMIAVAIELLVFGIGGLFFPFELFGVINQVPLPGFIRLHSAPEGVWGGLGCAMMTYLAFWYMYGALCRSDEVARASVYMRVFALPLAFWGPISLGHMPLGVLYIIGLDWVTALWTYMEISGGSSKAHQH